MCRRVLVPVWRTGRGARPGRWCQAGRAAVRFCALPRCHTAPWAHLAHACPMQSRRVRPARLYSDLTACRRRAGCPARLAHLPPHPPFHPHAHPTLPPPTLTTPDSQTSHSTPISSCHNTSTCPPSPPHPLARAPAVPLHNHQPRHSLQLDRRARRTPTHHPRNSSPDSQSFHSTSTMSCRRTLNRKEGSRNCSACGGSPGGGGWAVYPVGGQGIQGTEGLIEVPAGAESEGAPCLHVAGGALNTARKHPKPHIAWPLPSRARPPELHLLTQHRLAGSCPGPLFTPCLPRPTRRPSPSLAAALPPPTRPAGKSAEAGGTILQMPNRAASPWMDRM